MFSLALTEAAQAPPPPASESGKDVGDSLVDFFNGLPTFIEHGMLVLVSVLVVVAIVTLGVAMWRRMMSASLVVRPFLDGAVGVKVGPGMASLVEERLVGALRRKRRGKAGYDLDQVAIDIELLAEDNDLSKAVERLADVPQLRVVGALMAVIERMLPSRGLTAAGELLPGGSDGVGVALALYKGSRLRARSSLWEDEVSLWFPGDGRRGAGEDDEEARASARGDSDHAAHYGLAAPAAWWVQYEAARVFDRNVSLITNSAQSFALVGVALARERQTSIEEAEDAYAGALALDPNNVAALFNLAQLLARRHRAHAPAALLLVRAQEALESRHGPRPRVPMQPAGGQLLDPTCYRIQYALAVQCLEISLIGDGGWDSPGGWPEGMSPEVPGGDGPWKDEFGEDTQELLIRLARDQKPVQWPSEEPAAAAVRLAQELFGTATAVLSEGGWQWVGRRPPRFVRWGKAIGSWPTRLWSRLAKRRRKEPPVACDVRLMRFLSEVVEPAAVILYCSTVADEPGGYERFRSAVLERDSAEPRPVDRRALRRTNRKDWTLDYLKALLADQRIDKSRHALLAARLGHTQYRAPGAPDPRANYGLACMLSRLASEAHAQEDSSATDSFLWSAAAQLERSLSDSPGDRREGLAEWARLDPDLQGLREHAGATFETIVAGWGPTERRRVKRTKLDSSRIVYVAYKAESEILELQFEDGSRYQYFDVPAEAYEELLDAKSPDDVFNEKIEPKSPFVRV